MQSFIKGDVHYAVAASFPGAFRMLLFKMWPLIAIEYDTDTDTVLKFKQQTCMNRPLIFNSDKICRADDTTDDTMTLA